MRDLYRELRWLPRPPVNFTPLVDALDASSSPVGEKLRALTTHALDLNQLMLVARAVDRARSAAKSLEPLIRFRLSVLGNSTMDYVAAALVPSAARHGIALEVLQSAFDQVAQEALSPDSVTNREAPDAVLFAMDYRGLPLRPAVGDAEAAAESVRATIAYLRALRDGIKRNASTLCIWQTMVPPPERLFGNFDRVIPGTLLWMIDEVNRSIVASVTESGDALIDAAGLAEVVGTADWHDDQLWNLGKFGQPDDIIPVYADCIARTIASIRGKSRKALILDLDNTLWGGVIGDDGIGGIKLAQGDATGEAHLSLQRFALALRDRGIVLAVSSKNTDETARQPFREHPEMLLKLEHLAVFQANWNDKATNIRAIADELKLGLDALVFVDDNPAERELVRRILPEVAVPEMPDDPAWYARTVSAAGYFESISFTKEDKIRADSYQFSAKRAELEKRSGDLDEYLASLEMTIIFKPFDVAGRVRIAQLINKSNQFNLTTRRYTEPQIAEMESDPAVFTLQVRLTDLFGDNGMIGVVICRRYAEAAWEVDSWLMSCRVLGRRVEQMVFRELLWHARNQDIARIVGEYRPTDRNGLVVDHYEKLGFTAIGRGEGGSTRWVFECSDPGPPEAPMRVVSNGFGCVDSPTIPATQPVNSIPSAAMRSVASETRLPVPDR